MKALLAAALLMLAGCASMQSWCNGNPRLCDVAEFGATACVAVGVGLATQSIHARKSFDPFPKESPYAAASTAGHFTHNVIDAARRLPPIRPPSISTLNEIDTNVGLP
jgi:hypothetical protein